MLLSKMRPASNTLRRTITQTPTHRTPIRAGVTPPIVGSTIGSTSNVSIRGRSYHSTSPPAPPSRICPSCSQPIPLPLTPCPECSNLLPLPSNLSHHSMLYLSSPISASDSSSSSSGSAAGSTTGVYDLPREFSHLPSNGFGLDKADLRSKWLRRQRELHPDKFTAKGEKVIDLARELSGRVNEAYNVLGDELRRAEYLLSIHDKATDETDKLDDPMILAEILEAREELEEADIAEEIDRIRSVNHEKVEDIIKQLHAAFSETPPSLESAKELAVQLRYWRGLENAAKEKAV
ncbi:Fe-S protein assembly co-chaperone HscB [Kwoniella dejecticola CBS 10117]|uniref:Fe-S protein assembly co-chaperone HscB n=1 Tax=Kwoniella dejecticola CBS 10117 TaxID=1296121 RepID=A0A1A5ZYZ7_9TREE|nr:Fe-S protein assembly co-chaperone HscB [Kwoniella dejecticola CBS 10117]OBR83032.1 Fe-S protein assembly co-chaperone HscB [Kwoniella dejecticola CBS 10117]